MYVMKVKGEDKYLAIDDENEMYTTENIEEAKTFLKEKAENILENHSIPNWDRYKIKEYFPKPKNQIDYIEESAMSERKPEETDKVAMIPETQKLVESIYYAKVNIKNDIEYYNQKLTDVQRAITDVNHYMEGISEDDIKRILDIGTLNINLFKRRRYYKNKLELLDELNKALTGDFSSNIEEKLSKEKLYTPRILSDMFKTGIVPDIEDIFPLNEK